MTEQENTEDAKETPDTPEPPAESEKDEDEDEDKDEDDEKKSKKKKKKKKKKDDEEGEDKEDKEDKPKKVGIEFEATLPRNEAVSYFEAIVGGLRSGRLEFKQGDTTLILNPPERVEIEVKAQSKGTKGKVVFEIEWSEENRSLEISN